MTVAFRRAVPTDFPEVRRITRDAYLRAGHFTADHPYTSVLEDVEHRAEHGQVWVAEAAGRVVAAVTLTSAGESYSEIARHGELEFRMLALGAGADRCPRRDSVAGGQLGRAAACRPAGVRRRGRLVRGRHGTNAISEALVTGRPVQLFSAEHLVHTHHEWACTAAPITDPSTGRVLGVLDVSGPLDTLSADTLRMVRCAVRVAEALLVRHDGGTSLSASPVRSASRQSVRRPMAGSLLRRRPRHSVSMKGPHYVKAQPGDRQRPQQIVSSTCRSRVS